MPSRRSNARKQFACVICLTLKGGSLFAREKNAGSRKIVARSAMRSSSNRSDWERSYLQSKEEGNLFPAFHTSACISRVRNGLPQRREMANPTFSRQPRSFPRVVTSQRRNEFLTHYAPRCPRSGPQDADYVEQT